MLYLSLNGTPLRLPAETTAQVEHKNTLFTDGLQDSFSLPFPLPSQGNEVALKHVHELPLSRRNLVFGGAELGHHGVPLHPGLLRVLATSPKQVQASFSLEGFVQEVKGKTLPELLAAERIDLTDELLNQSISLSIRPLYEDGGKCQFPMYRNKDLYGNANPAYNGARWDATNEQWVDPSDWSASATYALNDRVKYTEYQNGLIRADIWTCIDAGGTSAGESPETEPSKWRRNAFGIVNAWDRDANQHHYNTTDGNFYAFVPWFYLKWVLKRALEKVGYTPVGSFMDDDKTHELVLPNNTTIDAIIATDETTYMQVAHSTVTYYDPELATNQIVLEADTESPVPLQDVNGIWDPTENTFTPDTAGTWIVRVALDTVNMPNYGGAFGNPFGAIGYIKLYQGDTEYMPDPNSSLGAFYVYPNQTSFYAEFAVPFGAGDIDLPYRFRHNIGPLTAIGTTPFPYNTNHGVQNVRITAFLQNPEPTVSVPDTVITPARHVPNVELSAFVNAIGDAFNLELRADSTTRTLRLDYKENLLLQPEQYTTQHDARLVNEVELDFQRAIPGVRLQWDVETHNEDETSTNNAQLAYSELSLPVPHTTGQKLVVMSTRQLYKTVFRNGYFAWEQVGYHVPSLLVGRSDGSKEVRPALKPVHMVHEQLDTKQYIVPELNATGTSGWYHTEGDRSTMWLCEFKRQKSSDGTVTNVPGARSWGWGWDSNDTSRTTLLWDQAVGALPGTYQRCWQRWLAMLTTAEPVTMDLLVDNNFLKGEEWRRILHLHGQHYLIEALPMTYGESRGQLMSQGVYAYRMRAPEQAVLEVELTPPTVQFTFTSNKDGALVMNMNTDSTSHFTIRNPEAITETLVQGEEVTSTMDPEGENTTYQVWASTSDGTTAGEITIISLGNQNIIQFLATELPACIALDLQSNAGLGTLSAAGMPVLAQLILGNCSTLNSLSDLPASLISLDISNTALESVDLSACTALTSVRAENTPLTSLDISNSPLITELLCGGCALADVDGILNALDAGIGPGVIDLSGGTNAAPTSASETNLEALQTAGWVVMTN